MLIPQLIAHDKEVYDIAFAVSKDVFGTVGADGSLRMFDLRCLCSVRSSISQHHFLMWHRSLEHSTILYESPDLTPLLKVIAILQAYQNFFLILTNFPRQISWNKQDPNLVATILTEANKAIIIDIRVPSIPMAELHGHHASLNGISW